MYPDVLGALVVWRLQTKQNKKKHSQRRSNEANKNKKVKVKGEDPATPVYDLKSFFTRKFRDHNDSQISG